MNAQAEEPPKQLPEPTKSVRELTYPVPHILKSITRDENGFIHHDIRQGGSRQIDFETTIEFSKEAVDEGEKVFTIRATNQINVANTILSVINDEVDLPGLRLVPTKPTATEYLSTVGQRIMVSSVCKVHRVLSDQFGAPVYQIARSFITLP